MNIAISKILNSVSLVQDLNNRIQMQIKIIVNKEISSYYYAIVQLDHIVETKKYLVSDSVYNEDFSGRVPRILINRLKEKAKMYFEVASNQNLSELKMEISELIELNRDLHFFLEEMKMEEGWGPF